MGGRRAEAERSLMCERQALVGLGGLSKLLLLLLIGGLRGHLSMQPQQRVEVLTAALDTAPFVDLVLLQQRRKLTASGSKVGPSSLKFAIKKRFLSFPPFRQEFSVSAST